MFQATLKFWQFYAQSFVQLLIEPGQFFKELQNKIEPHRVYGFFLICCGFFSLASLLTGNYSRAAWQMGIVFFAGTCGMVIISSFLGYISMVIVVGKVTSFSLIFSIYVFSFGITLFISWLPFFLWFSEPWKWWLIYTGFKNVCDINGKQAVLILIFSMTAQFFLLYSAHFAFFN